MECNSSVAPEPPETSTRPSCGRHGCACSLPIGERFVLWALRQWSTTIPCLRRTRPSIAASGRQAGLIDVLPDFSIAMDALVFGARRRLHIHLPPCSEVSRDEATLVALCALAQGDHDAPFRASLDLLMVPTASSVVAGRLKTLVVALRRAGLRLLPPSAEAGGAFTDRGRLRARRHRPSVGSAADLFLNRQTIA
jgi:hypothetical protein